MSFTKEQVDLSFPNEDFYVIAFARFAGQIDNHFPADKLLQICANVFFHLS